LAVPLEKLAVRFVLEEHLSDTGDDEWVRETEDNSSDQRVEDGSDEVATHGTIL